MDEPSVIRQLVGSSFLVKAGDVRSQAMKLHCLDGLARHATRHQTRETRQCKCCAKSYPAALGRSPT
jgi:hypothetical protein